jgi:DNA-binding Lrp family transcriptional regulator
MMAAFVFVQLGVTGGWTDARALHDAMHAVGGVKTVHFVAGPTDIIAFVETADMSALMEAVGKIRGLNGVASTDTRIVLPM